MRAGRGVFPRQQAAVRLFGLRRDSSSHHQHQTVHHLVRRENEENQRDNKVRAGSNVPELVEIPSPVKV